MANKYLSREDAPLTAPVWELLDKTMVEVAKSCLSGRRILPWEGPFGLGLKFVPLSNISGGEGVVLSQALPLVEIQKSFQLRKVDLANYEREGTAIDLTPLVEATRECACREDEIIFQGLKGIPGLLTGEESQKIKLSSWEEVGQAATDIIQAITLLDEAGFHGPYTLALAPQRYNLLLRIYHQGAKMELEHLKGMVGDGVVKAPFLKKGGVILDANKIYACLVVGQDMTIGFIGPEEGNLVFNISETLVPLIREPRAIGVLEE